MRHELKKFFKAFTYAFSGMIHGIKRERNIRFHLCAGATVIALMRFYELSEPEKCVIYLCIGGVIVAELLNTAVENAVDLWGKEISPHAKAAKDCAAGAVLVMSMCAAVCGIKLLWDTSTFSEIWEYFACRPFATLGAAVWAVAAFLFVFGAKTSKK
ncbi:MAG: diacylglycerol kinase family protein [Oscillospiraceae bacterium]|nr:diacylglycerol kinase family protein [Oscillospiraceae bacterium]